MISIRGGSFDSCIDRQINLMQVSYSVRQQSTKSSTSEPLTNGAYFWIPNHGVDATDPSPAAKGTGDVLQI
jgi:hypothetical protein